MPLPARPLLPLLHPLVLEQLRPLLPQHQLHQQPPHHLHSAWRPPADSGPVRLHRSVRLSGLLSQPRLPRRQPSEPTPTPPPSLDSRPTRHLCSIQLLTLHQEAFSLEEPVDLEPQTTAPVCLLLVQAEQRLLPPLPTLQLHLSLEPLGVDLTLHSPPHSI